MKEIKFRGKNSKDEWVYGSLIANETETEKGKFQVAFIVPGLPRASDGGDFYTARMERVKIETVGQFTGLKDKNGKEIYEGDTVLVSDWTSVYASDYSGTVCFRRGQWVVSYEKYGCKMTPRLFFDDFSDRKTTITGNIHEFIRNYERV